MKIVFVLSVLVLLYSVSAKPTSDDDYDPTFGEDDDPDMQKDFGDDYGDSADEDEEQLGEIPGIESEAKNLVLKPHTSVYLPCETTGNAANYVIMWKKDKDIIYQDKILLGNNQDKYHLFDNKTMLIKDVDDKDEGEYSCEIVGISQEVSPNAIRLVHTLKLETPSKILNLFADKPTTQYKTGDTLKLTCNATGLPQPKITWSLRGTSFESHDNTLIIENIQHMNSGNYQCLADNKVGAPAHQSLNIVVMHKPVVSIQKLPSNVSDESYNLELKCVVRSEPVSIVVWQKDGVDVKAKPRQKNDNYILTLKGVTEADFGKYTCMAQNQIGKTEQHVTISNAPSVPIYKKGSQDNKGHEVDMMWEVESVFPILEYSLQYKKKTDESWMEEKPAVTNREGNVFKIKHTLSNLEAAEYEVTVKARNKYGWSDSSIITHFKAGVAHKPHHGHQKQHKTHHQEHEQTAPETQAKEMSPSGSSNLVPTYAVLVLALLGFRH